MNGITGIDWLTTGREGPAQPMQAARSLRAALPAILLLIPFGIAYFYVPYSFMISYGLRTWLVCIASTIVVAWLALLRQILQREGAVVITYTDLLLPVFVASAFLLSGAHPFSQETPVSYVAAAMLYFCVRGLATPRSVYVLFLLLGALLLYSIGSAGWQAAGLSFSKGHLSMAFKATFGNVGLFAGYIAAMYAIFIFLALKYSPVNWQRPCCIMITAFFAMVMVFSQSRAALLSFLVSALLLSDIYLPHARRAISFIRKSHIAKLCIGLLVSLFLVFLFQIKSGSSYGRALIWKIAAKKFSEHPLTGIGEGRFMHDYLLWQSQYFSSSQATDQEKLVAGFTYLAFNEPLQLLLERGIVGVLLVGGIIWLFFRRTPSSSTPLLVRCIQVSGLSVLVTSLFSYPLHSLPLLFFLAVLIGIRETLSGTAVFRIPVKRYRRIMLAVAMLITGAMCWSMTSIVRKAAAAYEWTEALQKADISIATYEKLQNEIGFNAIFLFDYGNILLHNGRYDEAAQKFRASAAIITDMTCYMQLAWCEQQLGRNQEALRLLTVAEHMAPSWISPKAAIAKLMFDAGDKDRARKKAQEVLAIQPKTGYTFEVENIREQMKILLRRN